MPTPEARLKRLRDQLQLMQELYSRMVDDEKYADQLPLIRLQIKALEKSIREEESK